MCRLFLFLSCVFARRTAFLFVAAVLAYFVISPAFAAVPGDVCAVPSSQTTCTQEQAYNEANNLPRLTSYCQSIYAQSYAKILQLLRENDTPQYRRQFGCFYTANNAKFLDDTTFHSFLPCPSGTEWFDSLKKCDKPCSARNADLGQRVVRWASSPDSQCIAECKYQIVSDYQTRAITATVGGNTASAGTLYGGIWEYTGDRCPVGTPPKPREDEKPKTECTPAANGQTYCIMPNGDSCATSSAGRMICWRPSETGSKTDGPNTQTKANGIESPNPPPGSQHTSSQNITTTTTTNTSITTINTYTTISGAPAGSSNQGVGVDANGKPVSGGGTGAGDGTGEDNGNTAAGGGDCDSPPITSGDAILGMVAMQTWATRCAVEAGNAAKFTGDIGNCKAPFSVEGTNANAVKLRAMRAQICGPDSVANAGEAFDAQSTDAANAVDGDAPPDKEPDDPFAGSKVERDGNWFLDKLDATGFLGSGTCPADKTISVGLGSINLSLAPICTMLSAISGLVIALAYLIAFRIMAS